MAENLVAKEVFVLPLDFGHRQQAIDQIFMTGFECARGGILIFHDVFSFQRARAVHGEEPTADMAEDGDRLTDDPKDNLASSIGTGTELAKHGADELAVMPFLRLDCLYPLPFFRISEAVPVSAVGEAGCQLARIRMLQDANQIREGIGRHAAILLAPAENLRQRDVVDLHARVVHEQAERAIAVARPVHERCVQRSRIDHRRELRAIHANGSQA